MKMYNAIEHLVNRKNGSKETRENNYIWNKNKEELIKQVEERLEEFNKLQGRFYDIVSYEILERDLETLVLEGEVANDGAYDDFRVTVGDEDIENLLFRNFTGVKVKITIEPIE